MDFKNLDKSNWFRILMIVIVCLAFGLLIFQAGMWVGYKKADFSYRFGDNFHRTFNGQGPQPFQMLERDFFGSHGAVGKIVSKGDSTFIISGPDNTERVILISSTTEIRKMREVATPSDLKVNDSTVIFGEPNSEGAIQAKLIRIVPPPQDMEMRAGSSSRPVEMKNKIQNN